MEHLWNHSEILHSVKEGPEWLPAQHAPSSAGELPFLWELVEVKAAPDLLQKTLGGIYHGRGTQRS